MAKRTDGNIWAITPHPFDSDYDYMVTDDDARALEAILAAGDKAWDELEPGGQATVLIELRKPNSDETEMVKEGANDPKATGA